MPDNIPEEDWLRISAEFERVWNLPAHACGALDGKHIRIKKPADSGSLFYNYKNFSMVIMAVVDANYKFIWLSVGSYGSSSDGQIFNNSELRPMLEEGTLGLPPPSPLPHDDRHSLLSDW